MHTVVETAAYLSAAKSAGLSDEDRRAVVDLLAAEPESGDLMQGTGGCRKLRIAGRGKGKSGGYRLITAYVGRNYPVFLLTVFGKNEKSNLTRSERNELARLTDILAKTYRKHAPE
ncbi:type II toxin-antitoxin system RelE/ParE family toxin [Microbaculum marinum]|uniref:Type II toxin-antitoxin system RelE/ParE family toxin n=1 Tax=Microbaculum marinum TaxID=1764581 RepID=A0AAW9RVX9_9HYPH